MLWPQLLRAKETRKATSAPARACIVIYLQGGLSHYESFDPKPDAPSAYRSTFGDIPTTLPGIHFAEHLPLLAKRAHKFSLIRSAYVDSPSHPVAIYQTLTGGDLPDASVEAKNLAEFVALAKAKPGAISYGSAGQGSVHHLTMAVFAARAGIDVLHAPYRGGTALVGALMKGEVQSGWSGIPNVKPLIEQGTLKVLAISTEQRSKSLPNVPTAIEQGFKGFDIATMIGVQLSAGASSALVAKIQGEFAKAMREPDMAERFLALGMEMRENGTAHYTQYMKDDIALYAQAIKDAGGRFN